MDKHTLYEVAAALMDGAGSCVMVESRTSNDVWHVEDEEDWNLIQEICAENGFGRRF